MKLRIIWPGKTKEQWIKQGIAEYSGRISRYMPLMIDELKDEKDLTVEDGRRKEGEKILQRVSSQTVLIALDERGTGMDSLRFAEFIGRQRDLGTQEMAFAVGGAYGFSDEVRKRAKMLLAISAMTFTHQMIRPFLLEQIYRACTILNNESYHH